MDAVTAATAATVSMLTTQQARLAVTLVQAAIIPAADVQGADRTKGGKSART